MLTVQKTSDISIIIPTSNEGENITATIKAAARGPVREIIVVDGGSTDDTIQNAEKAGAKVMVSPRGRASQMNIGAKAAKGGILLFLHADTILPPDFAPRICLALSNTKNIAGAFRLHIDATGSGIRFIEIMANFRSKWLKMPYGDQAIFMRTKIFHRFGGFPKQPFMEDFALIRRLRQKGNIALLDLAVSTSARRWQRLGVFKTTLINQMVIAGYLLGFRAASLRKLYRSFSKVNR